MNSDSVDRIHQTALNYLSRREYSRKELVDKLVAKGFARSDAEQEVALLKDKGWQSDERFAESLLRSRLAAGYGPYYIERDLGMKGIDQDMTHALIYEGEIDWVKQAKDSCLRHFGGERVGDKDQKEHQKWYRYLSYKGFSLEQIKEVLDE